MPVAFVQLPISNLHVTRAVPYRLQPLRRRSILLLAVVAAWLASVTICTAGLDDDPVAPEIHDHHADQDHPPVPDDDCACKASSAFTAQTFTGDLAKAPVPDTFVVSVFNSVTALLFSAESACTSDCVFVYTRPPPDRWCFAEQILQHSLPGRAPPRLVMI